MSSQLGDSRMILKGINNIMGKTTKEKTMNIEEVKMQIQDLKDKLENKEFKGGQIPKAKKELEELEEFLAEFGDEEEAEESEGISLPKDDGIEEEAQEEAEEEESTDEELADEPVVDKVEEKKVEENKPPVEEKKEVLFSGIQEEKLEDIPVAKKKDTKKYKFTYATPNGEKMTLCFRKGKKILIRYGMIVELTDEEVACFPKWFKPL